MLLIILDSIDGMYLRICFLAVFLFVCWFCLGFFCLCVVLFCFVFLEMYNIYKNSFRIWDFQIVP